MSRIMDLIDFLSGAGRRVLVQTHNFPDHDAIAAAFGLQQLFKAKGIDSKIVLEGTIQRDSLREMISALGIEVIPTEEAGLRKEDYIVVVDGCKGSKNVADLIGEEIAVIDHHEVVCPEDVRYRDIRPDCGACSTIIGGYYQELGVPMVQRTATALMIGICMDTALLTRGVSEDDIQVYATLFPLANITLQNSILRNYIQTKDLTFYRYALEHAQIEENTVCCYFPDGCNQNLLGVLGDFFLALREVSFVILYAKNEGVINFSIRSERAGANAALIIQEVLKGVGFGGGHADMAGGIIKDLSLFDPETIHNRFCRALTKTIEGIRTGVR